MLLGLNAADALRCAPDYLTYFNVLVKPANSWRYLTDSNLDWGQGLIALREYEQKHPEESLRLAYFGSVNPPLYGVRAVPLAPEEHVTGKVVAGASALSGQVLADPNGYRWLLAVSANADDRPLDVRVRHAKEVNGLQIRAHSWVTNCDAKTIQTEDFDEGILSILLLVVLRWRSPPPPLPPSPN